MLHRTHRHIMILCCTAENGCSPLTTEVISVGCGEKCKLKVSVASFYQTFNQHIIFGFCTVCRVEDILFDNSLQEKQWINKPQEQIQDLGVCKLFFMKWRKNICWFAGCFMLNFVWRGLKIWLTPTFFVGLFFQILRLMSWIDLILFCSAVFSSLWIWHITSWCPAEPTENFTKVKPH